MPGGRMATGRGGGYCLQKGVLHGRGRGRQQAVTNENTRGSSLAFANLQQGPVPRLHTAVSDSYVTYCVFERRRNAKKGKTLQWLKATLEALQSVDSQVKILSYNGINAANAITHPSQIPEPMDQLHIYFPRIYMRGGSVSTKCKLRSSMPVREIKLKIMNKLQNLDYWITPSQLKATRTGKSGWFLGGHPELTYRPEFQEVLKPIIKEKFGEIEFQVEPENEIIVSGNKRIAQRVLVVRCPLDDVENIRVLFTEVFAEGSEYEIGFLTRYTFITSQPIGPCTKHHLQALLKSQQIFHKNIHYFIMYGVDHLTTTFKVIQEESVEQENTSENHMSKELDKEGDVSMLQEISPQPNSEQESDIEEANTPSTQEDNASAIKDSPPPQEKVTPTSGSSSSNPDTISLRMFLYLCTTRTNKPLFHAVHPTTENSKIYALCREEHMEEALQVLHNLGVLLVPYLSNDDINKILVKHNGRDTYVKDFPIITNKLKSYASALVNLAPEPNPQSDEFVTPIVDLTSNSQSGEVFSPRSPTGKRTRKGDVVPPSTPRRTYADSLLPAEFSSSTTHEKLNATVTENIARMKNLEDNQDKFQNTISTYSTDISKMCGAITNNSEAIKNLQVAQNQQIQTMECMQKTQQSMLATVNKTATFLDTYVKPLVETPDGVRGMEE